MSMRKHKGIVTLTVFGILLSISILIFFGYVIALSVVAGVGGGSVATWLSNGIRRYPNHYIDVSDTD